MGIWQVDGEEAQGDWQWEQQEERTGGSIESVGKDRVNHYEDGYETVRRPRPRTLGQYAPEIIAVDTEKPGDSITKELAKKRFCGYGCPKKRCDHRSCRSRVKEIGSVERVAQKAKGEVNEPRATPGWERVRVQIDSGAINTVGPKEIARAFEMKETEMSRRGIGCVAATGSSIKNYVEKIVGYTDDVESP